MSLVDPNANITWENSYDPPYLRVNRQRILGNAPSRILTELQSYGLSVDDPILIVGGGFGWMCEEWEFSNVAITDTSNWIQARLGTEAVLPILNNLLITAPQRNEIRSALGKVWPTWVITEDALPWNSDIEIENLIGTANAIVNDRAGGGVAHLISRVLNENDTPAVPEYNWKTLDQWAAFIASIKGNNSPRHIVISLNHKVESVEVL